MAYLTPLVVLMVTNGFSESSRPNSDSACWLEALLATAKFSLCPWSKSFLAAFITLEEKRFLVKALGPSTANLLDFCQGHAPVPPIVGALSVIHVVNVKVGHQKVFSHQLISVVIVQLGTDSKTGGENKNQE